MAALGFGPNDVARQYARLAQDCFLAGHYESATVMLGVGCEALIGAVADALASADTKLGIGLPARPAKTAPAVAVLKWLTTAVTDQRPLVKKAMAAKGAAETWVEPLAALLPGTGQAVRLTRNDLGHPKGLTLDQGEALQLFALFPRFAAVCSDAVQALA